jgi:uncharacterized membrane protein YdfJ with MMPL/SSD domain
MVTTSSNSFWVKELVARHAVPTAAIAIVILSICISFYFPYKTVQGIQKDTVKTSRQVVTTALLFQYQKMIIAKTRSEIELTKQLEASYKEQVSLLRECINLRTQLHELANAVQIHLGHGRY